MSLYTRLWLIFGLLAAYGAGFATQCLMGTNDASATSSESKSPRKILAVTDELFVDHANDEDDLNELLLGVLALEKAKPVVERSYGYQFSWRAERAINASRMLTDRELAEHDPKALPRLERLRTALEKFAEAVPDAAMSHSPAASAYQRDTRMQMVDLERMVRAQVVGGDGILADWSRRSANSKASPAIDLAAIRAIIQKATYNQLDVVTKQEAVKDRQALLNTLPELQKALSEWPPEFSKQVESYLRAWMKDWFTE